MTDLLAALPTPVVALNRAVALVRLGRPDEAVAAFGRALALTTNDVEREREHVTVRRRSLG